MKAQPRMSFLSVGEDFKSPTPELRSSYSPQRSVSKSSYIADTLTGRFSRNDEPMGIWNNEPTFILSVEDCAV